jgi:hypothetical protein
VQLLVGDFLFSAQDALPGRHGITTHITVLELVGALLSDLSVIVSYLILRAIFAGPQPTLIVQGCSRIEFGRP